VRRWATRLASRLGTLVPVAGVLGGGSARADDGVAINT
jgi:hypothetical protein